MHTTTTTVLPSAVVNTAKSAGPTTPTSDKANTNTTPTPTSTFLNTSSSSSAQSPSATLSSSSSTSSSLLAPPPISTSDSTFNPGSAAHAHAHAPTTPNQTSKNSLNNTGTGIGRAQRDRAHPHSPKFLRLSQKKNATLGQKLCALVPKLVHWTAASLGILSVLVGYLVHPYIGISAVCYLSIRIAYNLCWPSALHLDSRRPRTKRGSTSTSTSTKDGHRSKSAGNQKKRVAVIGGGCSGLACCKELQLAGHDVVCFEAGNSLGGVYAHSFYQGGRLTSSPYVTCFSDFEPLQKAPDNCPKDHASLKHLVPGDFVRYLTEYAKNYKIEDKIQVGRKVVKVSEDERGQFTVEHVLANSATMPRTEEIEEKEEEEEESHAPADHLMDGPFDHVIVCTGAHDPCNAKIPSKNIPGMDDFTGEVLHTSELAAIGDMEALRAKLRGRRVLTVGLGESAADLIAEVADSVGEDGHCISAVRAGAFVIPRINNLTGTNNDHDTTRLRYALPKWVHDLTFWGCATLRNYFDPSTSYQQLVRYSLMKALRNGPAYAKSTKSNRFVSAVVDGRCELVQSGVAEVVQTDGKSAVRFKNGKVVKDIDVILFCTGFRAPTFPFLDSSIKGLNSQLCPSHKWYRMFDPECGDKIAFVGFSRPAIGSIPPVAELQARLITQIFSGERRLPSTEVMKFQAAKDRKLAMEDFGRANPDGAWAALINWIPYMDSLAREIGCLPPSFLRMVIIERDPVVAASVLFGPMCAFHYRLAGPNHNKELSKAVLRKLPWGARKRDSVFFAGLHLFCMLFCLE